MIQNEALCNVAYADQNAKIMCPYDVVRLDPTDILTALRTHPVALAPNGPLVPSPAYSEPLAVAAYMLEQLPDPTGRGVELRIASHAEIPLACGLVAISAARCALSPDRSRALESAVGGFAMATLQRVGGGCVVRAREVHAGLVVDVANCATKGQPEDNWPVGLQATAPQMSPAADTRWSIASASPWHSGTVIRLQASRT